MSVLLRPCGERAVLCEVADLTAVHALARDLTAADLPVIDIVPAARTVLVTTPDSAALEAVSEFISAWTPGPDQTRVGSPECVTIDVQYNGPDLDDVAQLCGLSRQEVIARHTGRVYTVDFIGFAPGFGYLSGLDESLHVPRLDSPRTAVPAGSVAIAGDKAAVYPKSSPGGWRLIGTTDAVLFNLHALPPSLLRTGLQVRFREVG